MRALTVLQPFATALCREGQKRVENRPKPFPSTVPLPAWVAIHAGSRPFPDDDACDDALVMLGVPLGLGFALGRAVTRTALPMRRVVGAVRFTRSTTYDTLRGHVGWISGPYCWVRDCCVEIEDAPEIRGSLGLWSLNGYMDLAPIREAIASKYGADEAARAVAP